MGELRCKREDAGADICELIGPDPSADHNIASLWMMKNLGVVMHGDLEGIGWCQMHANTKSALTRFVLTYETLRCPPPVVFFLCTYLLKVHTRTRTRTRSLYTIRCLIPFCFSSTLRVFPRHLR